MCIAPIPIKNLNKGRHIRDPVLSQIIDVHSTFIAVPCGHCPSCLALKQEYFIQRFQLETLNNDLWTGMLSYNNEHLPTVIINGYKHRYADSRDIQLLNKRLRNLKVFPDGYKFWFISERGGTYHRPHWHFLISTPKIPGETLSDKLSREKYYFDAILSNWYTNKGSRRKPIKSPNLTYVCRNGRYNYDFHYVNPSLTKDGQTDVAFYTSKYYLKDDDYTKRLRSALRLNINDDDTFKHYWNLVRHKTLCSHYLGDYRDPEVRKYLDMCIDFSLGVKSPYPLFLNPETSQTFPLSPYYRKHLITVDIAYQFRQFQTNRIDGVWLPPDIDLDDINRKYSKYRKVIDRINMRDIEHSLLISNEYERFDNLAEDFAFPESTSKVVQSPNDFDCFDDFDDLLF